MNTSKEKDVLKPTVMEQIMDMDFSYLLARLKSTADEIVKLCICMKLYASFPQCKRFATIVRDVYQFMTLFKNI